MRRVRPEADADDGQVATWAQGPQTLLRGVQILDLADESASFCAKVLADLGASVTKVERPAEAESRKARSFAGDEPPTIGDLSLAYHDAGKLHTTLDVGTEEGAALLRGLVGTADVVVESFSPGYLAGRGCAYEVMREVNPGIVLASVTGFGQTGPRSGFRSNDLVASAYGGQMYVSGDPGGTPLRPYGGQSTYVASLFAAVGILLALINRRRTGKGERIDVSTQEAVAGTLDHVFVRYLYEGVVVRRQGNLSWNRSASVLPCRDGHLHVGRAV